MKRQLSSRMLRPTSSSSSAETSPRQWPSVANFSSRCGPIRGKPETLERTGLDIRKIRVAQRPGAACGSAGEHVAVLGGALAALALRPRREPDRRGGERADPHVAPRDALADERRDPERDRGRDLDRLQDDA